MSLPKPRSFKNCKIKKQVDKCWVFKEACRKKSSGSSRRRWQVHVQMYFKDMNSETVELIHLDRGRESDGLFLMSYEVLNFETSGHHLAI
jgi:hypothetical protein